VLLATAIALRRPAVNIAIAQFDNETGSAEMDRFADGLTDAVVAELTAAGGTRYGIIGNAAILRRPRNQRDLTAIRLPQEFINEVARLSHFDSERVKHLMKIAPGLIGARATWDESGIEAAAHMGLVPLARHFADHGAPVSTCTATLLGLRDRVESLVKSDAACVRERGAHDIALLAYTAFGDPISKSPTSCSAPARV
jgi:hypothetical protein